MGRDGRIYKGTLLNNNENNTLTRNYNASSGVTNIHDNNSDNVL